MPDGTPATETETSDKDKGSVNDERLDYSVIPIEAARAHLAHWWREPVAGVIAVSIGAYDAWKYGREGGLTGSLDEALIIGGIVLIAGSRRLFAPGPPTTTTKKESNNL